MLRFAVMRPTISGKEVLLKEFLEICYLGRNILDDTKASQSRRAQCD